MKELTVEEGIFYQTAHLEKWKKVLIPEAHERLVRIVTKDNDKAKYGYEICRGCQIDEIIHNKLMK